MVYCQSANFTINERRDDLVRNELFVVPRYSERGTRQAIRARLKIALKRGVTDSYFYISFRLIKKPPLFSQRFLMFFGDPENYDRNFHIVIGSSIFGGITARPPPFCFA